MATLKYWLWLTGRRGLGNAGALRVLDHFVTPERAFYADPEEYALVEDLTPAARRALPGCGNEIIYLIKYSSLAYIITCIELTGEAKVLVSRSFRPTEVYLVAGVYYLVLVSAATWILQKLERKFSIPGFGKK